MGITHPTRLGGYPSGWLLMGWFTPLGREFLNIISRLTTYMFKVDTFLSGDTITQPFQETKWVNFWLAIK
jgi:hypothetical protein